LHKNLDRKDADATSELVGRSTPCGRWNAFVSALEKREGTLACPRCKAPMTEVLRIAPVQSDPGLTAYECPSCGYITSVLMGAAPQSEPVKAANGPKVGQRLDLTAPPSPYPGERVGKRRARELGCDLLKLLRGLAPSREGEKRCCEYEPEPRATRVFPIQISSEFARTAAPRGPDNPGTGPRATR
jgi:hypothetical protein